MIHHGIDVNRFASDSVIDEERKYAGDHPVETLELAVVAIMKEQRFNVRAEGIQEVIANARFLAFVK